MTDPRAVVKFGILAVPFLAGLGVLLALTHSGSRPENTFDTDEVGEEMREALTTEYGRFVNWLITEYGSRWALRRPVGLTIKALRDQESFERYARATTMETLDQNGGVYIPRLNLIAFPAYPGSAERVMRHELVHAVLEDSRYELPPWVDEGLASALEEGVSPSAPSAEEIPLAVPDPPSIRLVLQMTQDAFTSEDNDIAYRASELWVTFLLLESPAAFDDFLRQLLAEGIDAEPALRAAFGDLDRLDERFRDFLRSTDGT